MQLGMIGLGRMGANMVRRLMKAGQECHVFDMNPDAVRELESEGATGAAELKELVAGLTRPRALWIMVPAAFVDGLLDDILSLLSPGDTVIDGGNSYYKDDIARSRRLHERGIHYVDVGTSGGVRGLERGYCMMIGGEGEAVRRLEPLFEALAPGIGEIARTEGRTGDPSPAEKGYLHCGPVGAGHFVKMVHNGIEYGLMAAYAEGFNILRHANVGRARQEADAETAPLRNPEELSYDIDVADVAELWRRGSIVASWLLDLTAGILQKSGDLTGFSGKVSDSGEGRWTNLAAIEAGVPVPVLSSSLYSRFSSRGGEDFANRILSAMRFEFGGHREKEE
jgi:6-phosphogluconate dehydrogenase